MPFRSRQMAANSSENGMVSATMSAPRTLPRNRKRMIDDQNDAFGEIVQHGVRGVSAPGRCGRGTERPSRRAAGYASFSSFTLA